MKIIAFIPARYGSTRLPGKPLINILDKPMIQHVYENALKLKMLDKVVILTDSDEIKNAVEGFGGEVCMTDVSITSGSERILSVLDQYKEYQIIVNIQGDEPLLDSNDIEKAIQTLVNDDNAHISTLVKKIDDNMDIVEPNVVKVVLDKNGYCLYFSRSKIPFIRDNAETTEYFKHIGLYIYRRQVIEKLNRLPYSMLEDAEKLEQLRFLENGYRIKAAFAESNIHGVDVKEDLIIVEKMLKSKLNI
ncbi:3-deoxy-manno-octulosonate cytidylyltransferase [bacterium]